MRERRAWSRFCLREISTFSRVFAPIVVLVSAERASRSRLGGRKPLLRVAKRRKRIDILYLILAKHTCASSGLPPTYRDAPPRRQLGRHVEGNVSTIWHLRTPRAARAHVRARHVRGCASTTRRDGVRWGGRGVVAERSGRTWASRRSPATTPLGSSTTTTPPRPPAAPPPPPPLPPPESPPPAPPLPSSGTASSPTPPLRMPSCSPTPRSPAGSPGRGTRCERDRFLWGAPPTTSTNAGAGAGAGALALAGAPPEWSRSAKGAAGVPVAGRLAAGRRRGACRLRAPRRAEGTRTARRQRAWTTAQAPLRPCRPPPPPRRPWLSAAVASTCLQAHLPHPPPRRPDWGRAWAWTRAKIAAWELGVGGGVWIWARSLLALLALLAPIASTPPPSPTPTPTPTRRYKLTSIVEVDR